MSDNRKNYLIGSAKKKKSVERVGVPTHCLEISSES